MATFVEDDNFYDAEFEALEPSLQNLIDQDTLNWIFVGGKGGVGKTTTSCSIAIQLARKRPTAKILIISTDPAHNLSDAFDQKFTKDPINVEGIENLFCMEIDPDAAKVEAEMNIDDTGSDASGGLKSIITDLSSSIPGIDEAMSFGLLMQQVQTMAYDVIVFDTAPTGHTLRLLSFPRVMESAFEKILALKDKFGGMFSQVSQMMGMNMPNEADIMSQFDKMKSVITQVHEQIKNPDKTTFVCVCIPEFLSVYETERLVQTLVKYGIDTHNIVVNQVLYPESESTCGKCLARQKMQGKYLDQVYALYEDFHVVEMPLLDQEVRSVPRLEVFSEYLISPYAKPE